MVSGNRRKTISLELSSSHARDSNTRHAILDDIVGLGDLEKLLYDPYINSVVQTAVDYVITEAVACLLDSICPSPLSIASQEHRCFAQRIL